MVDESDLEEIRKRKMEQLQDQAESEEADKQQAAQEAMRKSILRQVLTEDARERLGRLRVGYPDFARKVEDQLIYLAQSGQIGQGRKIDDETLKEILQKLRGDKRDINIERR